MKPINSFRKHTKIFIIMFLPIFFGAACLPMAPTSAPTPIIQIVEVDREVTREVTRIVEVPVTVTPLPTPYTTDTPTPLPTIANTPTSASTPTITPTPEPVPVTVLIHTQCLYGPGSVYSNRYEILANSRQAVIGRNRDSSWLYVEGVDHKDQPCWVDAKVVKVDVGGINEMPVTDPVLSPYSTLYPAPPAASANRTGNDVTIFWRTVSMSEADYGGYLIEAWVCQAGQLILVPIGKIPTLAQNNTQDYMTAVKVTDEPGCQAPSRARIYTAIKQQGYSTAIHIIPWPAWPTSTPTLTPAP